MRELAERAVKAKGWRWLPGMRALDSSGEEHPARVIDHRRSVVYEDNDGAIHEGVVSRSDVPDLTDPATLGCLLTLVRDAHRDAYAYASFHDDEWGVFDWSDLLIAEGRSEQEALIKALEAAP